MQDFARIHVLFFAFLLYFFEFNRIYRNLFLLKYAVVCYSVSLLGRNYRIGAFLYLFINALIFAFFSQFSLDGGYDFTDVLVSNRVFEFL